MNIRRLCVVCGLAAVAMADASARQAQRPAAGSWPPDLQQVSDQSPARSPADEAKTFYLPPGYHAELVASEPLIVDPLLVDWDADGRMWALEELAYMPEINPPNEVEHQPICR